MKFMKSIIMCMLIACLLCSFTVSANAQETGTITLNLIYKDQPVKGGSFLLFKVADEELNLTKDFVSSGISLEDLNSEKTANDFLSYAEHNAILGDFYETGENGKVKTEELELGVYLIVEDEMPESYTGFKPFLISVPTIVNGDAVYDVDATPKVDVKKNDGPSSTTGHRPPSGPGKNPKGKLPQTGQLWWPVPILAISGLLFFGYGWKRKRDEERG